MHRQFTENYFDYSSNCSDNSKKIFRLLRRLHLRQLRLATLGGSSSRTRENYRQRPGARHQLAPECGKSPSRPAISSTSATRQSQQVLGGSTTTSPPIVVVILRQQLDYIFAIFDYAAPMTAHPIKAKFSSSKSQLSTFATPNTRGLRHEQSSCISLTSKKL
jgi:hypothetical protein